MKSIWRPNWRSPWLRCCLARRRRLSPTALRRRDKACAPGADSHLKTARHADAAIAADAERNHRQRHQPERQARPERRRPVPAERRSGDQGADARSRQDAGDSAARQPRRRSERAAEIERTRNIRRRQPLSGPDGRSQNIAREAACPSRSPTIGAIRKRTDIRRSIFMAMN